MHKLLMLGITIQGRKVCVIAITVADKNFRKTVIRNMLFPVMLSVGNFTANKLFEYALRYYASLTISDTERPDNL